MCSSPVLARDRMVNMEMVLYEVKKILTRPSCRIALLLLMLLSGWFCAQVMWGAESAYWVNEQGQQETGPAAMKKLRDAQKEWSGTLDQELLQRALAELKRLDTERQAHPDDPNYVYKWKQGLQHIRTLMNFSFKPDYTWKYEDYYVAETVDEEQLPDFYENRVNQLRRWLYDEASTANTRFSEKEKQYLIRNYESLEVPFEVGYTTGWDMAYRISYYVILYGSIFATFLVSGIFANEFRWKADSVYFSTELGRKRGSLAKLASGFLFTTVVYWGLLLTVNLLVLSLMGFDGANCPIQTGQNMWNRIYNITFLQRNILALGDGYLLWMFLSALVMLVSAVFSSLSLSVAVPSLLMLGTNFLDRRGYAGEGSKIMMLLPHKMTTAYGNEPIMLYSVFGKIVPPITIQRVLYPCLTIVLAILCYQIFRRKRIR